MTVTADDACIAYAYKYYIHQFIGPSSIRDGYTGWGRFPLKTEVSPLQEFILPTHLIQHFPILGDTRKAY